MRRLLIVVTLFATFVGPIRADELKCSAIKASRDYERVAAIEDVTEATAELDPDRQLALLTLPSGEVWMFRACGGALALEESVYFDPRAARPQPTSQVVVRAEVVEYLGQVTWSFARIAEAPAAS